MKILIYYAMVVYYINSIKLTFLYYIIHIYSLLIFGRILMSWIPHDPRNPIFETLAQITDPYLNIFRRIIPPVGMIDFSPILAIMVLQALGRFVLSVG